MTEIRVGAAVVALSGQVLAEEAAIMDAGILLADLLHSVGEALVMYEVD